MKEVVKYSNELNKIQFSSINENQMNILFTILSKMRHDDRDNKTEFDLNEIFNTANINTRNWDYLSQMLQGLGKLQDQKFQYRIGEKLYQGVIFPTIAIDREHKKLEVEINPVFRKNYLAEFGSFTRFELQEFVMLSGTYTKTLYRLLKQFKSQGVLYIKYDEFKRILGVPSTYKACDIDKQILKPALKQLQEVTIFDTVRQPFENLSVFKKKNGRNIETLVFTFKPQHEKISEIQNEKWDDHALQTIANNIEHEKRVKQLKRGLEIKERDLTKAKMPINIFTGEPIDEVKIYIGQHFRQWNQFEEAYDTCKVIDIKRVNQNEIHCTMRNQETSKEFERTFESTKHLENFLSKHS